MYFLSYNCQNISIRFCPMCWNICQWCNFLGSKTIVGEFYEIFWLHLSTFRWNFSLTVQWYCHNSINKICHGNIFGKLQQLEWQTIAIESKSNEREGNFIKFDWINWLLQIWAAARKKRLAVHVLEVIIFSNANR